MGAMRQIAVIGIDLGKNSCSVVALDQTGAVVKRRRMRPESVVAFTKDLPPCIVAMEACCGAHHLGRLLRSQGHTVRLMSPEYVRPYVKAQKNDDRDAEAIAEAATRPTMRFVELKSCRCASVNRGSGAGALRSIRPSGPSALNRSTQSLMICSPTSPTRAASL